MEKLQLQLIAWSIPIGVGATLFMDLWAAVLKRTFGIPAPNFAMVGRWLGGLRSGRFVNDNIAAAPGIAFEGVIGWTAHYGIGIFFAGLLLTIWGADWVHQPSIGPAVATGIATVVAPFLLMQPGMGFGVAASKMPKPNTARLRSIATHTVFGVGLFVSAWVCARFQEILQ
jgi:hypothetical protein